GGGGGGGHGGKPQSHRQPAPSCNRPRRSAPAARRGTPTSGRAIGQPPPRRPNGQEALPPGAGPPQREVGSPERMRLPQRHLQGWRGGAWAPTLRVMIRSRCHAHSLILTPKGLGRQNRSANKNFL
ncbi:wiskott-Aldrich syndrome protein homolog, partial [Cricetulus griseus]|uniref:wiskott-Aldrich syndrome protein homolog n=1 Tax=Cricetulus griseus TaxID=10029 RepID=UPI0015C3135C